MTGLEIIVLAGLGGVTGFDFIEKLLGQRGQTALGRAQLELQAKQFEAEQKGTKMATKAAENQARLMMDRLLRLRQEEKEERKETELMRMMREGGDRQMAMLLGLLQTMQTRQFSRVQPTPPILMSDLMRGAM